MNYKLCIRVKGKRGRNGIKSPFYSMFNYGSFYYYLFTSRRDINFLKEVHRILEYRIGEPTVSKYGPIYLSGIGFHVSAFLLRGVGKRLQRCCPERASDPRHWRLRRTTRKMTPQKYAEELCPRGTQLLREFTPEEVVTEFHTREMVWR